MTKNKWPKSDEKTGFEGTLGLAPWASAPPPLQRKSLTGGPEAPGPHLKK